MSKKSTSSHASPEILEKLRASKWTYDESAGVGANWDAALKAVPELAEQETPLYRNTWLKKTAALLKSTPAPSVSSQQAPQEENPFSVYLEKKTVAAKNSQGEDTSEGDLSRRQSFGVAASPRDLHIFNTEMEKAKALLNRN